MTNFNHIINNIKSDLQLEHLKEGDIIYSLNNNSNNIINLDINNVVIKYKITRIIHYPKGWVNRIIIKNEENKSKEIYTARHFFTDKYELYKIYLTRRVEYSKNLNITQEKLYNDSIKQYNNNLLAFNKAKFDYPEYFIGE